MNTQEQLLPTDFDSMVAAMLRTNQTQGMTVYQHGQSVYETLEAFKNHLKGQALPKGLWRLPAWLERFGDKIVENLHDDAVLQFYTLYHDCGKPYCLTVDEDGKRHFHDHAKVSSEVWLSVGGDSVVGNLIKWDMDVHICSATEIAQKLQSEWSCKDSVSLLLVALSEIHSNARIFGGVDSLSFKSKFKHLDRRGNQICKHWFSK